VKTSELPVAVIGGGYAGMAAAVELTRAGRRVHVLEAGPVLGGRARRVDVAGPDGQPLALDNGQHLLVGAYRELLRLMQLVGIDESTVAARTLLDLDMRDGAEQTFRLACPRLPAPLHSAVALLRAAGLSWGERLAAVRAMNTAKRLGWRLTQDTAVLAWLQAQGQSGQLIRCLWEPLTLAALNTPVATASAQVLLNVLRDSLAADRAASDFLVPRADLSTLFPDAAGRYVTANGGQVGLGQMVKQLDQAEDGWYTDRSDARYSAVVLALPPHRLDMLTSTHPAVVQAVAATEGWAYQPIYTVYLGFPAGTRLPKPMLGLVGTTTQWLFDRSIWCGQDGIVAAIISAEGDHQHLGQDALVERVIGEALRACPALPRPIWHKVIAEKRATFACTPGLARPANATQDASLVLAGDYTAGDYPATIEGAVRSGVEAANLLVISY